MIDVRLNSEAKVYTPPPAPAIELEDREKPQVKPVQEGSESVRGRLDDRALHGRSVEEQKARQPMSEDETRKVVAEVQERLDTMGTRLQLTLNKDPNSIVVQVLDRKSGELIRQFPPKELLDLQKKLSDLVGILFDEKA
ncbi:MAG: hypothetical protein A2511_17795 [Deltaproteobacteria bacterium RIFOXYD12_FULL_50_9]|nr:MAG: hypothetical protein A2511_17795 [Deltaproteobacteria bacterium RIFOXYD12_FULL_50_9]